MSDATVAPEKTAVAKSWNRGFEKMSDEKKDDILIT